MRCKNLIKPTNRNIFKIFQEGEPLSAVLTAEKEIEEWLGPVGTILKAGDEENEKEFKAEQKLNPELRTRRGGLRNKILAFRKKRDALRTECSSLGLRTVEVYWNQFVDDLQERDDSGKLIETTLTVETASTQDVQKALDFCKRHNLMALPIGARTSALGVFEEMSRARMHGFEGVLGIQMYKGFAYEKYNKDAQVEEDKKGLLKIPPHNPAEYELIKHQKLPIAVLKSKTFPADLKKPHRVIVHAGTHIDDVNQFAQEALEDPSYRYRLMPDPTSKDQAQIGGIIVTGAEGGNRTKATEDILACNIVNGNGQEVELQRDEAKKIVGLNGAAGIVTQAEFELTAFPPHQYGVFIPIHGDRKEIWMNMFKVQNKIKNYCQSKSGNNRLQIGGGENGLIITGIEPLSHNAIDVSTERSDHPFDQRVKKLMAKKECGLYITFSTFNETFEDPKFLAEKFLTETLGLNLSFEDDTVDKEGNFNIEGQENYNQAMLLADDELKRMDQIRHGAPSHSREKAKKLGGVSESTDLNIRFTSTDEAENKIAMEAVAKLYEEYATPFDVSDGFRVAVYGHMHPGVGEGGGVDPHVRIIFELSNPGSRYNAPEQVIAMKKKQTELYRKLMALEGQYGIQILCPEKSRFTNTEYWNWYCLHYPDKAREYLETVVKHGYSTTPDGKADRAFIGARIPHSLPGVLPRIPGGIKAILDKKDITVGGIDFEMKGNLPPLLQKYWKAILEISQLSHRGSEIKRAIGDVCGSIHEKFHLSQNQYPFFIECPEEGEEIIKRNFGDTHSYTVRNIKLNSLEDLERNLFPDDENTFYIVSIEGMGVPRGLSLLITPQKAVKESYEGSVDGTNKAAFRNLYSMWEKWPSETDETPNIPAILSLGLILEQEKLDQQAPVERDHKIITANPGPAQIHEAIKDGIQDLLTNKELLAPQHQKKVAGQLKKFLGIPAAHSLAFFTSATQIMQVVADALSKKQEEVNCIQITNDAFSERFNGILKSKVKNITTIKTPWTTSENSDLKRVIRGIVKSIDTNPGKKQLIFVTPHKTSTTADFLPDILIKALVKEGKEIGRDYDLVSDVTSGAGARDYATLTDPDSGAKRIPFTGMFGSVQKALGLPPGLAYASFSPKVAEILGLNEQAPDAFSLAQRFKDTEEGKFVNPLAIGMLGQKLEADLSAGRTPATIQQETQKKINLVMGWLQRHPDLRVLVQNGIDQSPSLLGVFSQAKNLVVAKRLLADIFGYFMGEGYGPFSKEAIRLYLPNIAYRDLKNMLAAMDVVLELDDVVKTRGEKIPNIALREPHDPYEVIDRLSREFTIDHIFLEDGGLGWLDRLIKTYNANVPKPQRKRSAGRVPVTSAEYNDKAKIYGFEGNKTEMEKIVNLKDENKQPLIAHYALLQGVIRNIKHSMEGYSEDVEGQGEDFPATMELYVLEARRHLGTIAHILKKYVDGTNGVGAALDAEGRIAWPIVT